MNITDAVKKRLNFRMDDLFAKRYPDGEYRLYVAGQTRPVLRVERDGSPVVTTRRLPGGIVHRPDVLEAVREAFPEGEVYEVGYGWRSFGARTRHWGGDDHGYSEVGGYAPDFYGH